MRSACFCSLSFRRADPSTYRRLPPYLLIMRELSSVQRAILSFWLRHEARGKTPLVLTDELTKRVINEKKLPAPDEQEENLIQLVGKTLESGKPHLAVDLRYLASEIGAPSERILRDLVAHLLEKDF